MELPIEDGWVDPRERLNKRTWGFSHAEPETQDCRDRYDAAAYTVGPLHGTLGRADSMRSNWEKLRRRQPRELAILIDRAAAVRLWLDRNGSEPRVILEDLEQGDHVSFSAVELRSLIVDHQELQDY